MAKQNPVRLLEGQNCYLKAKERAGDPRRPHVACEPQFAHHNLNHGLGTNCGLHKPQLSVFTSNGNLLILTKVVEVLGGVGREHVSSRLNAIYPQKQKHWVHYCAQFRLSCLLFCSILPAVQMELTSSFYYMLHAVIKVSLWFFPLFTLLQCDDW